MKILKVVMACFAMSTLASGSCGSGNKTEETNQEAAKTDAVKSEDVVVEAEHKQPLDIDKNLPTVIDFYATWCGPCRQMAPVFHELAEKYEGKINFVSIDVDKNPDKAMEYQVEALPTFIFLNKDGKEVNMLVGADPEGLKAGVEVLLSEAPAIEPTAKGENK